MMQYRYNGSVRPAAGVWVEQLDWVSLVMVAMNVDVAGMLMALGVNNQAAPTFRDSSHHHQPATYEPHASASLVR